MADVNWGSIMADLGSGVISSTLLAASLSTVVILISALSFFFLFTAPKTFDVPIVGIDNTDSKTLKLQYVQEADILLKEGYSKFKNTIFQILTPDGPRLFLPRKYAMDLKVYNRHQASGMKALADRHIGNYTTIDHESDIMLGTIKIDLNRNLGNFVGDVQREVTWCFNTTFPPCQDWVAIDIQEKLTRVVAQASARIFVGLPLCRSEEWLTSSINFATDVMVGAEKLKLWHPLLRPIAQYFVPEVKRIQGDHKRAHDLLLPELKRRAAEDDTSDGRPFYDTIEWMQQRARKLGDTSFDSKELAKIQMLTATAAIHTTRLALTQALFDLAARPEYLEPLREEIRQVTKDCQGLLQKQHLTHLKRMDSFMKESIRHSPPSVATFQRKALIPIDLSDGFHIPSGTIVQCNTNILDETPAAWGNPHEFDGFRFYKLRTNPEDANKFQFSGTSYDSMQFGFGNDACPGRFFASNQIKIILVHILQNYDIKMEEGVGRPKNIMFEVNVVADPTAKVLFKKLQ